MAGRASRPNGLSYTGEDNKKSPVASRPSGGLPDESAPKYRKMEFGE
jgi:hypothetical protein